DFQIGLGYGFLPGDYVAATDATDSDIYVAGVVTAYSGSGVLSFAAKEWGGSGVHGDWVVGLTGRGGAPGIDANQSANTVKAGPTSGADAAPGYRSLVADDIPALAQSKVTGLVSDLADKAPLASPALTGTPTAPTATNG